MPDQSQEPEEPYRFKSRAIFFESSEMYYNRTIMNIAYRPMIWRGDIFGNSYHTYQPTPERLNRLLKLAANPRSRVVVDVQKINGDNVTLSFSTIENFEDKAGYFEFLAKLNRLAASQPDPRPEPEPDLAPA